MVRCVAGGSGRRGGIRTAPGLAGVVLVGLLGCAEAPAEGAGETRETGREEASSAEAFVRPPAQVTALTSGDTVPGHPSWTRQDRDVFLETLDWIRASGTDTLPMGDRMVRIGRRFVGTAYIPRTLDPPGPERLVVNFRAFDCVTFVETVLALARLADRDDGLAGDAHTRNSAAAMQAYEDVLASIRYRGGDLDGYPSRLHYFSEWLRDAEEKGMLHLVTHDLGGVVDEERVDFMTSHPDAYDQLADSGTLRAIRAVEERLARTPRYYVPEASLAEAAGGIRSGDVIAATSTVDGLDVAHTGIALRDGDGVLRLMHAPLVGEDVQISERSLPDRILAIDSQDGVMVGRPLEPGPDGMDGVDGVDGANVNDDADEEEGR